MTTKAVRMYGKKDLRLEEFELPAIKEGEILAHIISDSLCMSSYKAAVQGSGHKRVPDSIADRPVIVGHEICGELVEVGAKWKDTFKPGQRFSIQPALNYKGTLDAPGYSYEYIGGDATYVIIPEEVMTQDCLLGYEGDAFFFGSLSEPMSTIIGAHNAQYHVTQGTYVHEMGIVEGGTMAILAGAGPMGLGHIDYTIHGPRKPRRLVVTDIDQARLDRAAEIYTREDATANGVELTYVNTRDIEDPVQALKDLNDGQGYDDVFVLAPVAAVVEQGDAILGKDGCLNFFAGPTDTGFSAKMNFYDVHYASHHVVGTSGGNTEDMRDALDLMGRGVVNPVAMITHVGGLDAVVPTTLNLPNIPGGKKLMYTNIKLDLTAIDDFEEKGKRDPLFAGLAEITAGHNGLWSAEAEKYLLENAEPI
ncbi:MAG: zinc-binding dehydrogenase [Spirochaetaceae bacterium]